MKNLLPPNFYQMPEIVTDSQNEIESFMSSVKTCRTNLEKFMSLDDNVNDDLSSTESCGALACAPKSSSSGNAVVPKCNHVQQAIVQVPPTHSSLHTNIDHTTRRVSWPGGVTYRDPNQNSNGYNTLMHDEQRSQDEFAPVKSEGQASQQIRKSLEPNILHCNWSNDQLGNCFAPSQHVNHLNVPSFHFPLDSMVHRASCPKLTHTYFNPGSFGSIHLVQMSPQNILSQDAAQKSISAQDLAQQINNRHVLVDHLSGIEQSQFQVKLPPKNLDTVVPCLHHESSTSNHHEDDEISSLMEQSSQQFHRGTKNPEPVPARDTSNPEECSEYVEFMHDIIPLFCEATEKVH